MYCTHCGRETDNKTCPVCGESTTEQATNVIYWCDSCQAPIIGRPVGNKIACPQCGKNAKYLCRDLRPVFPEERLLFELMEGKPLAYLNESVWATGSRYYINGKPQSISNSRTRELDPDEIRSELDRYENQNSYDRFNADISEFTNVNLEHEKDIAREAARFIEDAAADYPLENIVLSFSGGKDSTVVADLAVRTLSDPYLVHIFGDTTLEFPTTTEYVKRFRESHPLSIFKTAKNNEQDFFVVAEEIGPPARLMRWCCSMFKTGPITRAFNNLYGNQSILTFQGVRKNESVGRSKYSRIGGTDEAMKIQQQKVALPIFYWNDIDVWLYILAENLDFNQAYRLGFERIGCWCCPNNNPRDEFLANLYMPEEANRWHNFLVNFAKSIGKPDAEDYVNDGKWKARQGGNGVSAAATVEVDSSRCTTEDNAVIFSINRPFSEELVNLFTPIGDYAPGLGRSLLEEKVFVDPKTKEPIFSVMPFSQSDYEHAVKVRVLGNANQEEIFRMSKYQVVKYNACRQCLKCESLCKSGAISICGGAYLIDKTKCTHCHKCVTDKFLEGGCLMRKYLKTKRADGQ